MLQNIRSYSSYAMYPLTIPSPNYLSTSQPQVITVVLAVIFFMCLLSFSHPGVFQSAMLLCALVISFFILIVICMLEYTTLCALFKCFSYVLIWAMKKYTLCGLLLIFGEHTVLANLMSTWHQLESLWKREPNWESAPTRLANGQVCGAFSELMINMEGPISWWALLPLGWSSWAL